MVRPAAHYAIWASIVGVVVLASGLSAYFCLHFTSQVIEVVSQAGAVTAELKGTVATMYRDLFIILVAMVIILSLVVSVIVFYFLIRLTGAEFAINRHISEKLLQGDLSPVRLRKGDYLQELAGNLNMLVEKLKATNN